MMPESNPSEERDLARLQAELDAARETIAALKRRVRVLEAGESSLPFQRRMRLAERRAREAARRWRRARDWFELLVRHSLDAIIRLDDEGRVASWNPAAERMFGYAESEAMGRLLPALLRPAELDFGCFTRGDCDCWMGRRMEGLARRKDGAMLPVEVVGIRLDDDGAEGWALTIRDIRERKEAERRMREANERLEAALDERTRRLGELAAIVEGSRELVAVFEAEGGAARVLWLNPAGRRLSGVDDLALRAGVELERLLMPGQLARLEAGAERIELRNAAGEPVPAAATLLELPGETGWRALVARDLREEIELRRQLEHVDRLESLGVLAGGIAHDFNNILTAILGHAELAMMEAAPDSDMFRHLSRIEESSHRAARLCQQMLAYSGKGQMVMRLADLSEIVRGMQSLLASAVDASVSLSFALAEDLPALRCDATQIEQIVLNLVVNASEAMEGGAGLVRVETGVMDVDGELLARANRRPEAGAGRYLYLRVRDDGCGMDEETRRRLFDPFFTTKFTGRGLGMSAVLGIVHGHGGMIHVESAPGEGSCFTVLLPPSSDRPAPEKAAETRCAAPALPQGAGGKVLVIDDEPSVRDLAGRFLRALGYEMLEAGGGAEGLRLFRKHRGELAGVILDLTMPLMDGVETLRRLRELDANAPVLLASGYSEEEALGRCGEVRADGFLMKPWRLADFSRAVAAVFAGRVFFSRPPGPNCAALGGFMSKISRNAPCPCGSGRKYKQCCLNRETERSRLRAGYRGAARIAAAWLNAHRREAMDDWAERVWFAHADDAMR